MVPKEAKAMEKKRRTSAIEELTFEKASELVLFRDLFL